MQNVTVLLRRDFPSIYACRNFVSPLIDANLLELYFKNLGFFQTYKTDFFQSADTTYRLSFLILVLTVWKAMSSLSS